MEVTDNQGNTALIDAALEGHAGCVRLLVSRGANKEARNKSGTTALYWAARQGHSDCVRLLVEGGANMDSSDENRQTALLWAASKGDTDCVRLLLDGGANKDAKSSEGLTPLMHAAANGHTDCARLLIFRGADKNAKDNKGLTVLEFARVRGQHDVACFIASCSGAKFENIALMDPKIRARFMGRACHNCFKTRVDMPKCVLCLKARYCSKACQQIHWPLHKAICDRGGEALRAESSHRSDESACSTGSALPDEQEHNDERTCHFCAKSQAQIADRLKRCDRCRSVFYCSVQCQRSDWSAHKKQCAKPATQNE